MIFYVRKFRALWDAWEFCSEITKNKNLISKPIIIERAKINTIIELVFLFNFVFFINIFIRGSNSKDNIKAIKKGM